ncbi:MAG: BrnT family toxin [Candidatus Latescibacteria bacterium]|nr:BrnT family toxin [Candidatus Latescibacterota bacterium]
MGFEWDREKDLTNQAKHGVSFSEAQHAFLDSNRVIAVDHKHSTKREMRYFCFGMVRGRVLTVRFTYREDKIRIFGAGYWGEGKKKYEDANRIP